MLDNSTAVKGYIKSIKETTGFFYYFSRKETSPLDSSFLAMTTSAHSLRMFYGAREEV